ncbi:MAG TPA: tetratricopeptide repeat protein [Vicinamibacterales bacterium]|nr:tetratricopeptide repeat protein [Vicinamibacterales bacterium]
MSRDSIFFGVAGIFFGVLVGWIIGSQQGAAPREAASAPSQPPPAQAQRAVPLDEARAAELKTAAESNPADAATRVQLGNMYFDAERFEDAARWYEDSLKVDPRNADASTDLGIAYYYMNQADRALAQFDRSLSIDPKHSKTLLNIGIVRAFGKQDLAGAAQAWQRVLDMAPDTPEARAARQALDGLRNAHPDLTGASAAPKSPGQPE